MMQAMPTIIITNITNFFIMRLKAICSVWLFLLLTCCVSHNTELNGDSQYQPYAPDGIPFEVSTMAWEADQRGNHRAVVQVSNANDKKAVEVTLPWRRPDLRPDSKRVLVVDGKTDSIVKNVLIKEFSSESAQIVFEPISMDGTYYVYYLPYRFRRGWDDARYGKPWNDYLPPVDEADSLWKAQVNQGNVMKASVCRFESRTRFDAFTPMGLIATEAEEDSLKNIYRQNPIVFPEDRAFPIRLTHNIPVRWAQNGPSDHFHGYALRNEYYTWQIGIWAAHDSVENVKIEFSDLQNGKHIISKSQMTCFNQEGTNWDGQRFESVVNVPKNKVQALWCGVQIPEDIAEGVYKGQIKIHSQKNEVQIIPIQISINAKVLKDKGDGDLWRHARLRWLNSTIGNDSLPVKPFKAMTVKDDEIIATDKTIKLSDNGFPSSIQINGKEILAKPMNLVLSTQNGEVTFNESKLKITQNAAGLITAHAVSENKGFTLESTASIEYDGYIHYKMKLKAPQKTQLNDVRLENTHTAYASKYFMGIGFDGGLRPAKHTWNWEGPWDSYWLGNSKAGLHFEFRGGEYHGPLLNDYRPLPPAAWTNGGKGKVVCQGQLNSEAQVIASTGSTTLSPEGNDYEFDLLITPAKPVDTHKHFSERYYHAPHTGFDEAAKEGANIINIHHAQKLNPVINYPFIVQDSLKAFIAHEHQFDRKVKLYYTIRELTNYTTEIFALKSLNHEILASGVGYGIPWLCEHLIDDYKPAWYTELPNETSDAALVLSGFSRWINYYLEGLRWMFENYKLDGIYMDDVSFDRPVMKRMRKIIEKYRPGALIDLHSNTAYSIGPANQYTGFFPYIDRLWFGEHFFYNKMRPDEWFVTFSGIPFGMMSEMLQDGGNRFLGMVYGATARHSYGPYSPAPVWNLWKSFGIEDAQMIGYWEEDCPVKTSDKDVKATVYLKKDKVLVALGNFGNIEKTVKLNFNWEKLGLQQDKVMIKAPVVKDFQNETIFQPGQSIPVKAKEGWLLIIEPKK